MPASSSVSLTAIRQRTVCNYWHIAQCAGSPREKRGVLPLLQKVACVHFYSLLRFNLSVAEGLNGSGSRTIGAHETIDLIF